MKHEWDFIYIRIKHQLFLKLCVSVDLSISLELNASNIFIGAIVKMTVTASRAI